MSEQLDEVKMRAIAVGLRLWEKIHAYARALGVEPADAPRSAERLASTTAINDFVEALVREGEASRTRDAESIPNPNDDIKEWPLKYCADGKSLTVAEMAEVLGDGVDRMESGDPGPLAELIDREFLWGCYADMMQMLKRSPYLQVKRYLANTRGLLRQMYIEGRRREATKTALDVRDLKTRQEKQIDGYESQMIKWRVENETAWRERDEARAALGVCVEADRSALVEAMAESAHEAWWLAYKQLGYTSRKAEWGEEFMVPFAALSERGKEFDRVIMRAILAAFDQHGFVVARNLSPSLVQRAGERWRAMEAALQPFAHFARQFARQPLRGTGDTLYAIHLGTEYAAEITLTACRAALDATETQ